MSAMCQKEDPLLIIGPIDFKDTWVEMIMPSLSALFSESTRDMFSDH